MRTVVGNLEIRKNNFATWLFGIFTACSIFALLITWDDKDNSKWIVLAGIILFGIMWLSTLRDRISVHVRGFEIKSMVSNRMVNWKEITDLSFDIVYHGHSSEASLMIQYLHKTVTLPVRQYQRKPMQRFFEVLHEQCTHATKNEAFIQRATGQMNWRKKLSMF